MAQNDQIVAVVDTSALFGSKNRHRLVALAIEGHFIGVWSPHIIGELYRVLTVDWIAKHGQYPESRKALSRSAKLMMDVLLAAFELQDTAPYGTVTCDENVKDPDDNHLLLAARRAGASYIVSENTRDFPDAGANGRCTYDGIEYLTPQSFFQMIEPGARPDPAVSSPSSQSVPTTPTPAESILTPEQRLLRSIFGEFDELE